MTKVETSDWEKGWRVSTIFYMGCWDIERVEESQMTESCSSEVSIHNLSLKTNEWNKITSEKGQH